MMIDRLTEGSQTATERSDVRQGEDFLRGVFEDKPIVLLGEVT